MNSCSHHSPYPPILLTWFPSLILTSVNLSSSGTNLKAGSHPQHLLTSLLVALLTPVKLIHHITAKAKMWYRLYPLTLHYYRAFVYTIFLTWITLSCLITPTPSHFCSSIILHGSFPWLLWPNPIPRFLALYISPSQHSSNCYLTFTCLLYCVPHQSKP